MLKIFTLIHKTFMPKYYRKEMQTDEMLHKKILAGL